MSQTTENAESGSTSSLYPRNYFFYGSLMDPERLSQVLRRGDAPVLLSGTVTGYRLMLWGPYPALIPDEEGSVSGLVYAVQTSEDAHRLQSYETNNYAPRNCRIKLDDGTWKDGETFVWAGPEEQLEEGIFDLEAWQAKNAQFERDEENERLRYLLRIKPSIMARKFESYYRAQDNQALLPSEPQLLVESFPRLHFLYGSLVDPEELSRVLGLTEKPMLRPAQMLGFRIAFWGSHLALVSDAGNFATGVVHEVQNSLEAQKIKSYAPENYKTCIGQLRLEDGTEVAGSCVEWQGNKAELRDL